AVSGTVAEEHRPLAVQPHGPLGPEEAGREHLDHRPRRHQRVEPRVEPLDRAHRWQEVGGGSFFGAGGERRGNEHQAEERDRLAVGQPSRLPWGSNSRQARRSPRGLRLGSLVQAGVVLHR
ncbi:MAG: hypothetical protein ACK55I_29545, partial [bacterium]